MTGVVEGRAVVVATSPRFSQIKPYSVEQAALVHLDVDMMITPQEP